MTQGKNRFLGREELFPKKLGEPRFVGDEGLEMERRLNEILADIMYKLIIYMQADTSYLDELKAEEAELVVQSDGEHMYIGRKTISDPKQLSALETGLYTGRIQALEWAAKVKIFSTLDEEDEEDAAAKDLKIYFSSRGIDPTSALQYMHAYLAAGEDPDEVLDKIVESADEIKENPHKYEPEPERATEYLAACVETIRQIVENHRFTREQFQIVYPELEKLAGKLSVFPPEFTEEEKRMMREEGESEEEIDAMLKGAQQCHKYYCQTLDIYRKLANEILNGESQ